MTIKSDNSATLAPADAEYITAVRAGDTEAFAELYHRHVGAANRLARILTHDPADADDLVAETFAKVLGTLRDGRGPDLAFRAYLLTTLRHVCYDRARRDRRVQLTDDFAPYEPGVAFEDEPVAELDRSYAARAFAKLPERWQMVLWHTEVEGETPAQVAPLLGLTPNGVAALAYRARERLRQMYLQEHINDTGQPTCHSTAERLGAAVRHGLSTRDQSKVDAHLDGCAACRQLLAELADINAGLRGVLGPLVLGGSATAYLAGTTSGGGWVVGLWATVTQEPTRQVRRLTERYGSGNVAAAAGLALAVLIGSAAMAVTLATQPGPAPRPPRAAAPAPTPSPVPEPTTASPVPLPPLPLPPEPPVEPPPVAPPPVAPPPTTRAAVPARPAPVLAPVALAAGLLSGGVAEIPVPVRQPESAAAPTDLTLTLGLPTGIRLHAAEAGDGWRCAAIPAGARCRRAPLARGASTTARVQVDTAATVTGFRRIRTYLTANGRGAAGTVPVAVAPAGTRVAYALTGRARTAVAGNTLLSCLPRPACLSAPSNDLAAMAPYRPGPGERAAPAALAPGSAASGASIAVPAGATVRWAGLFWAASAAAVPASVTLHGGPGARWQRVTASRVDRPHDPRPLTQAYADVTALVRGGGPWWVAAPAAGLPVGPARYAGWSLVIVYDDPRARVVDLAVYAGPAALRGPARLVLSVAGPSDIGLVVWDGDPGLSGDALLLDKTVLVDNVGRGVAAGALGPARSLGVDVLTRRLARGGQLGLRAGDDQIEIAALAVATPAGTL